MGVRLDGGLSLLRLCEYLSRIENRESRIAENGKSKIENFNYVSSVLLMTNKLWTILWTVDGGPWTDLLVPKYFFNFFLLLQHIHHLRKLPRIHIFKLDLNHILIIAPLK